MKIYEAQVIYSLKSEGKADILDTPAKIVDYMKGAFDQYPMQESFWIICLNRKNRPLCRQMISLGTVDQCLASPREILKAVILASSSTFICVHNHPSGDPAPSSADVAFTRRIREASQTLEIPLMDHVIIGNELDDSNHHLGYYSFRDAGMII